MKKKVNCKRGQQLLGFSLVCLLLIFGIKYDLLGAILEDKSTTLTLAGWFLLGALAPLWNHHLSKKRYRQELMNHNIDKLETTFTNMNVLVDQVLIGNYQPLHDCERALMLEALSYLNDQVFRDVYRLDELGVDIEEERTPMFLQPLTFWHRHGSTPKASPNEVLDQIRYLTTHEKIFKKHGVKIKRKISKEQLKLLNRYNLEY